MVQKTTKHAPSDSRSSKPDAQVSGGSTVAAWKFRLIVLKHYKAVYRLAYSLLRNHHEAEDIVQEAFVRLWQQEAGVRRPEHWLMKVAHNLSIDRLRTAGRLTSETDGLLADDNKDERDPAWHYQHGELRARLGRVLDTLPEIQRSLIILYDVQGQNGAACADILGISVDQVKVYLHRARRRLRLKLENRNEKG